MKLSKDFALPQSDEQFLNEYGLPWETIRNGAQWVLLHNFPVPEGYIQTEVTTAIRIETGYPHTALDMVYFNPPITRKDGQTIKATEAMQAIQGTNYQRWSRHRTPQNPWLPGKDNLESHITLIEDWLDRELEHDARL